MASLVKSLQPGQLEDLSDNESTGSDVHSDANSSKPEMAADDGIKGLAGRETKAMNFCKTFIVLTILVTGGLVATGTYRYLTEEQDNEFQNTFSLHASIIQDITKVRVASKKESLMNFAEEITAYAKGSDSTFPLVTVPYFEVNAGHVRSQAGVESLTFTPLVSPQERPLWEPYSVENQYWIEQGRDVVFGEEGPEREKFVEEPITPFIYDLNQATGEPVRSSERGVLGPMWQTSPPQDIAFYINMDILNFPEIRMLYEAMLLQKGPVTGDLQNVSELSRSPINQEAHRQYHEQFVNVADGSYAVDHPHATIMVPISRNLPLDDGPMEIVGFITARITFDRFTENLLPNGAPAMYMVLENTCGQTRTYLLGGESSDYLGEGDLHDFKYDDREVLVSFESDEEAAWIDTTDEGFCRYRAKLYPSNDFHAIIHDSMPYFSAIVAASVFLGIVIAFFVYDGFVNRRNSKIMAAASKTSKIVMSLFPSNVLQQLLGKPEEIAPEVETPSVRGPRRKKRTQSMMSDTSYHRTKESQDDYLNSRPIADLFPECTVMFGDIAGFTAWSSVREPAQVFILLENLYRRFDDIAKRRRVFKVETIGDCYVAVCGLPDPRKDHAVVMARFARECMESMKEAVKKLEVELGPDTAELSMRIGLHSGPVTAGVLRGERARFQLFGDTVNTAARMESTGLRDRIHLSTDTANLLFLHGKESWVVKREESVVAKGKGTMETWWLVTFQKNENDAASVESSGDLTSDDELELESHDEEIAPEDRKVMLLSARKASGMIGWNTEVLARMLKKIVASRGHPSAAASSLSARNLYAPQLGTSGKRPMDEVVEIIELPENPHKDGVSADRVELSQDVMFQLRDLVASIAALYHENPFHNFEHASHVTMSVVKLLTRIVAPSYVDRGADGEKNQQDMLHDHTYGITSDPLTQFACVFSALIHDVDHHGVPNTQLVKEQTVKAQYYNKSVAEQNSVDLAWNLLMQDDYAELRQAICANQAELCRFRQLVVQVVLATDIMDKNLKILRNARWEKAFADTDATGNEKEMSSSQRDSAMVQRNRKATIVIEHLIQASDVAHTMQHWHVYRKWNERLFKEMAQAYKDGRAEKHPGDFWYQGELGFFDFYIIPLAKKLKDCGVFGVSSDEYLTYAQKNRQEWQDKGKEIVADMINSLSA